MQAPSENQENYTKSSQNYDLSSEARNQHKALLYRDIYPHLKTYLEQNFSDNNKTIRLLDFGCGPGESAERMKNLLASFGYEKVEIFGIDINEKNLELAKQRLPNAEFLFIDKDKPLPKIDKKFDIALLFYVCLEMEAKNLPPIFKFIYNHLNENGLLLNANCSAKMWDPERNWITSKASTENKRHLTDSGKMKYTEDQPVKLTRKDGSFTFTNRFHSGNTYDNLYKNAGFNTVAKIKPKANSTDAVTISWLDETKYSPFTIYIIEKTKKPEPTSAYQP